MTTVFGIKNCNSMKKAFDWLTEHQVEYVFHDYKKQGVPPERLLAWCQQISWQKLLNTRGTTWRKLNDEQRNGVDQSKAILLMSENPSLIKRPVIETDRGLLAGFDAEIYSKTLIQE